MNTEEWLQRLTGVVETLAATTAAHDSQIESLIAIAERTDRRIEMLAEQIAAAAAAGAATDRRLDKLAEEVANTEKQWQAYLRRLPAQ